MRVLVIGGTRFIGPAIVRALVRAGHRVTIYHRGQTESDLPPDVEHIHGDRAQMAAHAEVIRAFGPDAVVDVSAYTERDAHIATATAAAGRLARRFVAISSADVYRAFGVLARLEKTGALEPLPITERSPVRSTLFPYRALSKGPDDWTYDYEKLLVERVVLAAPELHGVVLRLPAVYGPETTSTGSASISSRWRKGAKRSSSTTAFSRGGGLGGMLTTSLTPWCWRPRARTCPARSTTWASPTR
jgi:nucleoside-diphosphate-sugar epimerase